MAWEGERHVRQRVGVQAHACCAAAKVLVSAAALRAAKARLCLRAPPPPCHCANICICICICIAAAQHSHSRSFSSAVLQTSAFISFPFIRVPAAATRTQTLWALAQVLTSRLGLSGAFLMSPAVTRATAASAHQSQPLTSDDQTSAAAAREPFVPKRKPSKPAPYAYLVTEASNSVDSLPIRDSSTKPGGLGANFVVPARPASALETASYTAPFSPAHQQPTRASQISHPAAARTLRSASRDLAPIATHTATASAPVSAAATPRLKAEPAFSRNPFALEEPASRPRSLTPSVMAGRSAAAQPAAPSTPRIKAAVSADVAARIRSPRKHASVSALRATAASEQRQPISSRSALAQAQTQLARDAESLAEAHAHSSSTWQTGGDTSNDGEHAGDSSFVYDADADAPAQAGGQETVQVHVRLRPPKRGEECAWVANPYSGTVALEASIASGRTQSANLGPFTFDGIQTGSANRPVYISVARPLVRAALDGYDAVVFAYGQTASGKTFTLSGDERGQEAGIIPRAVRDIFRGIQQSSARREYLLRASYLEIWNEVVKDLLEPSNVPQVRDDKRRRGGKGTTVQPLREEIVTSPAQVRELLARGQANRHVGATDWNERSSRSHTCFKMTIESWERDTASSPASGEGASKLGKKVTVSELCLIDLAGSEKYVSQGSDRRAEGAHINKSLLTLGKVIYALSEKGTTAAAAGTHIPYRDSKLTRILQNSLSGNARVAVVCTINPNPSAVDESLSTLNFAKRIKKVGLHARRNEVDGSMGGLGAEAQALILRYQTEADALRKMVQELERQGAAQVQEVAAVDDERIRELQERLDVIGSLVVRGGRAHDGEPSTIGTDSGDEQDDEPGQLRTPSGSSTLSTARSAGLSTPATSRSASQSSCTTAGASAYARPVSPVKRSSAVVASYVFGFDDPPHILAEKLFLANRKIEALSRKLASRPSLPSSSEAQVELVARQQQQIRELEAVCEAQAQDAPPKIREDVEREFAARLAELERKLEEKDSFIAEIQAESDRLRRANAQLMELAHQQTRDMVENLASPQRKPSPLKTADTNARRRPLDSPTKSRPRPMSLFNPTSSELAGAFAVDTETKKSTPPAAHNRRSISNDYTLLKLGTQHIEHEIDQRSATIPASETFAALPGQSLAALVKASVGPTIEE